MISEFKEEENSLSVEEDDFWVLKSFHHVEFTSIALKSF